MELLVSGARVTRSTETTADEKSVFAELFEVSVEDIQTFAYRLAAREFLAAHRHTGPVAARIGRGAMAFVLGDDLDERVDLAAGDFVWLPAELAHEEMVTSEEAVDLLVAQVGPFDTEPA